MKTPPPRHAVISARTLLESGWREHAAIVIEHGQIAAVLDADDPALRSMPCRDPGERILVPGFIDCQVNGGGGVLLNDMPTVDGIRRIAEAHRRFGTTALLPTLISDRDDVIRAAIRAVDAAIAEGVPGIAGIHIEGPFLAPERKGVHDPARIRRPDSESLSLLSALEGGITLVTLAPEQVPTDFIRDLAAAGVRVSAGHTAASYAQIRAALDAGVCGFTHLFNAMSPLTSRAPGAVGAALEDAASGCGVIVDGHHVHPASLRVALAAKPRGTVFLVTDAMPPVGASGHHFTLHGRQIRVRDGQCQTGDGVLAGSALDMASAVRNSVSMLGLALDEALRMASTYPARFLGLGHSHGRIATGARADLVALDEQLRVTDTWIGGLHAASV